MKTPVVFCIFNRPEEERRVFEAIRRAKPSKLYVIADGARNAEEAKVCAEARAIIDGVDWPCEVIRDYSDKNLGCKMRIFTGIDSVFKKEERAIILEDDCVPDDTFFPYCEELLERYKDDTRIMHISGSCNQVGNSKFKTDYSYYAATVPNICGWASWRRAWNLYDIDIKSWPEKKRTGELTKYFPNSGAYERFSAVWDKYYNHGINSWDGQWTYACISRGSLNIHPSVNLITNVGNVRGAHPDKKYKFGDLPTVPMQFPLKHPPELTINKAADAYTYRHEFGLDHKLYQRMVRPIKEKMPWILNAFRSTKAKLKK